MTLEDTSILTPRCKWFGPLRSVFLPCRASTVCSGVIQPSSHACGNWGSGYRDQNAGTLAAAVAVTMSFMSHPREFHLYLGSHDAMQADLLTCK